MKERANELSVGAIDVNSVPLFSELCPVFHRMLLRYAVDSQGVVREHPATIEQNEDERAIPDVHHDPAQLGKSIHIPAHAQLVGDVVIPFKNSMPWLSSKGPWHIVPHGSQPVV